MILRVGCALALGAAAFPTDRLPSGGRPAVPDFSGRWRIDTVKSAQLAKESKGTAFNAVLGDECTIIQTADAITFHILSAGLKVEAVYKLDGSPSHNTSPGSRGTVPIVSTTDWVGDVLHIVTNSESELDGAKVAVSSLRKVWLTAEDDLAVERRGKPARVVPDAWSVYRRVK